jgi:hypothetical protein
MTVKFSNPSLSTTETTAALSIDFVVTDNTDDYFNVPGLPALCFFYYKNPEDEDWTEVYIAAYACDYDNFSGLDTEQFPPDTWVVSADGTGDYSKTIEGLEDGITYYFMASVLFPDSGTYIYIFNFIVTYAATNVYQSTATLNGALLGEMP